MKTAVCDTIRLARQSEPPAVSAEQKLIMLQLNTDEGFLLLDTNFKIITFNRAFQKLWINYAMNIHEGDPILSNVPASQIAPLENALLKALAGDTTTEKLNLSFPDQSIHTYVTRYKPAYDEFRKITGIYISLTDITHSPGPDLNAQLNKRTEELMTSQAELERFAYIASHDLQEPLRMVSSFLQLLEKKYKPSLDETAQLYITYAVDGAAKMKRLIMDLLEYSRVGTNKEKFVDTDMNEVITQVLETFGSKAQDTGALFNVQALPMIKANKIQMIQLLQNLVSNSLKYTNSFAPEIEIGCEDKDDSWQFFVKDNGIGIEEKFFDRVFILFQRLYSKNQFSGTGIGLTICKKIVEKHGGIIWIKSVIGKGSTFFFTVKK